VEHIKFLDIFESDYMKSLADVFADVTGIDVLVADPLLRPAYCTNKNSWIYRFMTSKGDGENFRWLKKLRDSLKNDVASGREMILSYPDGISLGVVPISVNGENFGGALIAARKIAETRESEEPDEGRQYPAPGSAFAPPAVGEEHFDRVFSFIRELNKSMIHCCEMEIKLMMHNDEIDGISKQMGEQYTMLRKIFDSGDIGVYVVDYYTGNVITANKAYCSIVESDMADVISKKCWELERRNREDLGFLRGWLEQIGGVDSRMQKRWIYYNEKFGKWFKHTAHTVKWFGGIKAILMTVLDVSAEETLRGELYKLAYYDSQTGLPNELMLRDNLEMTESARHHNVILPASPGMLAYIEDVGDARDIYEVSRYAEPTGTTRRDVNLIAIDLSSLWHFRNAYGLETTNCLLDAVIKWFTEQGFYGTTLYRTSHYGFCAMTESADRDQARFIAKKIMNRFQLPWPVAENGEELSLVSGAKVTVIYLPSEGMPTADALLRLKDAKEMARPDGDILEYDEIMDAKKKEESRFKESLKCCVQRGMAGFDVHFQPIVGMASGKWDGVEALCRWTDPESGPVSPARFIPEAERAGLIVRIGTWVLENAIERCKTLGLDKTDSFFLSVNISPIQLMDMSFADNVLMFLRKYDYPGRKLNLEITESVEVTFNSFTLSVIEAIRSSGVKIALDDFGTGYSSFNNLKNLPVDFLKTECSFVRGIEHDAYTQYYFNVITDMAHASGMKLITEGVDSKERLEIVRRNGADYVQGYYFSKPISYDEMSRSVGNFKKVCPDFARPTSDGRIKRWLGGDEAYFMTPNLSDLLSRCMSSMYSDNPGSPFDEVLEIVGRAFGLGRAFVFRSANCVTFSKMYEWRSDGVEPHVDIIAACQVGYSSETLLGIFRDDGIIAVSDTGEMPEEALAFFAEQGIVSIALLPIWNESDVIGVVGFDDHKKREWSSDEIFMLRNLGVVMSGHLRKEHMIDKVEEKNDIIMGILNSAGLTAFVTDPATDSIIWANGPLKNLHNNGLSLDGGKCYEVIEGRSERCPNCKLQELMERPDMGQISFERFNAASRRLSVVYQSLIQWTGGKQALMEYSVEIPGRGRPRRITSTLGDDETLDVMSESAILEYINNAVTSSYAEELRVSIALMRIEGVNGGESERVLNWLTRRAVECIKHCVRSVDAIGRIGNSELVVVFDGCDAERAGKRLAAAQCIMDAQTPDTGGHMLRLKYGIAENVEFAPDDEPEYVSRMLELARERIGVAPFANDETMAI
jgi:EAL domain-containing protein (putative c-di-GMP-specific phosphodiesterase class I)/GGDEF domain-containing protein/PAS domain-containing protein